MAKRIKINTAIYGKKSFKLIEELIYYKRYKELKIHKDLVDDIHQAIGRAEGFIECKSPFEDLDAWQYLIDTGIVWQMNSRLSETARYFIDNKILKERVVH